MSDQLPPLREELRLYPGPQRENGEPTWTLQDPLRNRFFRIGWFEFEILSRWHLGNAQLVTAEINRQTPLQLAVEEVEQFRDFLLREMLLFAGHPTVQERLNQQAKSQKTNLWQKLLKNYLFFRIPLFHPDAFLTATLPWVRAMFRPGIGIGLVLLALLGLYLAGRQWEDFLHTFVHLNQWQGLAWFALSLTLTKVAHELGHAYAAKHYGLQVPVMGVAFLVLWPVLYTDMSEGWKLNQRHQRMVLAASGVMVELGLALLATLLWSFTPDGPLRSALFLQATTSWIATLLVNLSPFMRFDGYYLFSDLLDIPNLQERAFALGRWSMRRLLLGLPIPPPELFSIWRQRLLIFYAWLTWVYRLTLFTGVALMVYHFFFKALGLVLFVVEVGWFILLPIYKELKVWWSMRPLLTWNRNSVILSLLLAGLLLLLLLPWQRHVTLPALLQGANQTGIYASGASRLVSVAVRDGQVVRTGETLFILESPSLTFQRDQAARQVEQLEESLKRQVAVAELADQAVITQQELDKALTSHVGLQQQVERLHIRAPSDGVIRELTPGLHPGRWLNEESRLALLVSDESMILQGFAGEEELQRLQVGQPCHFIADRPELPTLPCQVEVVGMAALKELSHPAMASIYGGPLAVDHQPPGRLLLRQATYPIRLVVADEQPVGQSLRGVAVIQSHGQSPLMIIWQRLVGVLIRESGF
ncbi:MAG: HlyD family efflux transporter periplasmic adaptor subunit [Magnetococcales bacterium]|nr:HlyD family efflux transporter periplasmic adaptor subunit [Magnetococcales bacterium]NGZ27178.1 HlyD family efflux transporter periplasmic adaptor subunit [Magnetococcales bacterium]